MKRIGLIIPHSDITLETDLQQEFNHNEVIFHTTRIFLKDVSHESEKIMVENLSQNIKYLQNIADFSVGIFGCTSASVVEGKKSLEFINKIIADHLNCKSINAFEAVLQQIRKSNSRNITLISPYTQTINENFKKIFSEFEINVNYHTGLGLTDDRAISQVSTQEIVDLILANKQKIQQKSELCFISCTNFRALEIRKKIKNILAMEVITTNSAIIETLKRELK